jgi:hypothetical protein
LEVFRINSRRGIRKMHALARKKEVEVRNTALKRRSTGLL